MWMILGRILLVLMLGNRDTLFHRLFAKVTDPIYAVVRKIMPFVKESCVPATAVFLIIVLRLALIIIFQPATSR
jgi:uncharacterized protein YggT (Ycf19 family)